MAWSAGVRSAAAGAGHERGDGGRADRLDGLADDGGAGDDQGVGGDVVVAPLEPAAGVVAGDRQRPSPLLEDQRAAPWRDRPGASWPGR